MPGWLVLMLVSLALGAAAVLYAQHRWLPTRLTAEESTALRQSYAEADAERQRLRADLAQRQQQLDRLQAERDKLRGEAQQHARTEQQLREDIAALVEALPPDPRAGAVAVRAARFAVEGEALAYDVVLSRERAGAKPLAGVLQLVVAGTPARGPEQKVALAPVPVSVNRYDSVRGRVALPQGFKPRQTTVLVLDQPGGRQLGMRVINVR